MSIKNAVVATLAVGALALMPKASHATDETIMCTYNQPNCTAKTGYLWGCTYGSQYNGESLMIWLVPSYCEGWCSFP